MPEAFTPELGREQFLNLFVTQLQHQDPLSPMDQTDSLAQLAQFSQLEASTNLNTKFEELLDLEIQSNHNQLATVGAGLLGREVSFGDSEKGVVDEVSRNDGQILVRVGEQFIPMSDVNGIAVAGT
ncbi:MAG: flagellar biosynthesis protein FlgD [Fuerstiella sp.]|nr:flagellar biosynthesis protein FlgD [Fuerstiella sp.]MCP4853982.1 flagellar biosynthesis protein FlgD [Fuerstiella sp.]